MSSPFIPTSEENREENDSTIDLLFAGMHPRVAHINAMVIARNIAGGYVTLAEMEAYDGCYTPSIFNLYVNVPADIKLGTIVQIERDPKPTITVIENME